MVMHMITAAVAGASGYAGGELLRLLLAHPEVEIGALTRQPTRASARGRSSPTCSPLADRVLEDTTPEVLAGHDVVFLALPHGQSAAVAEQLGERCSSSTAAPTSGSRRAGVGGASTARRTPAPGPTACPNCPVPAPPREALREAAHRGARLLPDRRLARALPGLRGRALAEPEAVIVAASGTSGAGKALKPHLLGSEVMGSMTPYGVGGGHRHTPEMIRTSRAAAGERVTRLLHADPRPDAPRHPRHVQRHGQPPGTDRRPCAGRVREGVRGRAVRPPAPRGPVARHRVRLRFQHRPAPGRRRRAARPHHRVSAIDNLTKGTAGGAVQSMNIALGLPETWTFHDRESAP